MSKISLANADAFQISDYTQRQMYFRSGVKKGILKDIPLSKIDLAEEENRDFQKKHSEKLGGKIKKDGLMDAFKVAPYFCKTRQEQRFKIGEANHRGDDVKKSNEPDETVPCVVLWWVDGADKDQMYEVITGLNTDRKNHTLYDDISRAARVKKTPIYCEIFENIKLYGSKTSSKTHLSVGNLVGIYDGFGQPSDPKIKTKKDRTPTKTGKFVLPDKDRPYVEHMLIELVNCKAVLGSELQNDWLENFIFEMHTQKNKIQNFDEWKSMFDDLVTSILNEPQQTGKSRSLFNKWFTAKRMRMAKIAKVKNS